MLDTPVKYIPFESLMTHTQLFCEGKLPHMVLSQWLGEERICCIPTVTHILFKKTSQIHFSYGFA